jgi:hypothetical protein
MSMDEILTVLTTERDRLDRAIEVLRGTAVTRVAKNGVDVSTNHAGAGRRPMSLAARRAMSERMRKYWAKRTKSGATTGKKS